MTPEICEGGLLATLKLQLEGLAILFAGAPHDTAIADLPPEKDDADARFDNFSD